MIHPERSASLAADDLPPPIDIAAKYAGIPSR
jgi:hypothetical protein